MGSADRYLFIHAGGSKTGSSAIQNTCEFHVAELNKSGFAYEFSSGLTHDHEVCCGNGLTLYNALLTNNEEEIAGILSGYFGSLSNAICSCEFFSELHERGWQQLIRIATSLGIAIKVIFYVRSVIPFLLSDYDQSIKSQGEFRSLEEWSKKASWQHINTLKRLDIYSDQIALQVMSYDKNRNSLLNSFFEAISCTLNQQLVFAPTINKTVNRSLTNCERELLITVNRALGDTYSLEVSNLLLYSFPNSPPERTTYDSAWADLMQKRFQDDVIWVNKRFGEGVDLVQVLPPHPSSSVSTYSPNCHSELREKDTLLSVLDWALVKLKTIKDDFEKHFFDRLMHALSERSQLALYDVPADFDPLAYLLLNSDVFLAGFDPLIHYNDFGKHEARPYRFHHRSLPEFSIRHSDSLSSSKKVNEVINGVQNLQNLHKKLPVEYVNHHTGNEIGSSHTTINPSVQNRTSTEISHLKGSRTNTTLVVVIGMHRSGTSAITRSLKVFGISLSDRLLEANTFNAKGYWEDVDVNNLNIDILKHLNEDWHTLKPISAENIANLIGSYFFAKAVTLLCEKTKESTIFGFKDPRLAKLLPFWKEVFHYCGFQVKYIIALRNPISTCLSLSRRDKLDSRMSYSLWVSHLIYCLIETEGSNRIVVDYDQLMESPDKELDRMSARLGLPVLQKNKEDYIQNFLDEKLRHSSNSISELSSDPNVLPLALDMYSKLVKLASDKLSFDDTSLKEDLLKWHNEFMRQEILLQLIDELAQRERIAAAQIHELNTIISDLSVAIGSSNDINSEQGRLIDSNFIELAELKKSIAEKDILYTSLKQKQETSDNKMADVTQLLHDYQLKAEELTGMLTNYNSQITTLSQMLSEQNDQLAKSLESNLHYVNKMSDLTAALSDKDGIIHTQRAEIIQHKNWLNDLNNSIKQKDDELSAAATNCRNLETALFEKTVNGQKLTQFFMDELQSLLNCIEIIKKTMIWRATAPLRFIIKSTSNYTSSITDNLEKIQAVTASVILSLSNNQPIKSDCYDTQKFDQAIVTNGDILSLPPTLAATSLNELLSYQSTDFIICAYNTLLKRQPDSDGFNYYLRRLKSGAPKIEIISQIAASKEANVDALFAALPDLKPALLFNKIARTPIIKYFISYFLPTEGYSAIQQQTRALEQQLITIVNAARAITGNTNEMIIKEAVVKEALPDIPSAIVIRPSLLSQLPSASSRVSPYIAWRNLNRLNTNQILSLSNNCGIIHFPRHVDKKTSQFLSMLQGNIRLVSFDIFDTLLERATTTPSDIFSIIGLQFPDIFKNDASFAESRISAESEARRLSSKEEITLDDIYEQLAIKTNIAPDHIARLKQAEIECEMNLLRPKSTGKILYKLAKQAKVLIVFTSDIYLPHTVIESALKQNGYDYWDDLLLSCETGQTKHFGSLYRLLISKHGVMPSDIIHVGDNAYSDIDQAQMNGITPLHVIKSAEQFSDNLHGWNISVGQNTAELGERLADGLIYNRFGNIQSRHGSKARFLGSPYLLGYAALGPVLLGFTKWLIDDARTNNHSSYCFLSRDGYYLMAAYDLAAAYYTSLPKSKYVVTSRVLCNLASINTIDDILAISSIDHFPMPIGKFLSNRFAITDKELDTIVFDKLEGAGFESLDSMVRTDDARKQRLLNALANFIFDKSKKISSSYSEYLSGLGIDFTTAPVVDIGYSGTSQKAISKLLGVNLQGRYLITSKRAKALSQSGLTYESWLGRDVELNHDFFSHVQNWELFLSATHGSATGFDVLNGAPTYENLVFDEYSRGILAILHRGALDFVADYLKSYHSIFFSLDLQPAPCAQSLSNYFAAPDTEDCIVFSKIIFEDKFGGDVRPLMTANPIVSYEENVAIENVWAEASHAIRGNRIYTPYWPCWKPDSAQNSADNFKQGRFIDEIGINSILPAAHCNEYEQAFDKDGFPVSINFTVPLSVVIPATKQSDSYWNTCKTLQNQLIDGWCTLVVRSSEESSLNLTSYTNNILECSVAHLSEIIPQICSLTSEWALLTDGNVSLEPTALGEFLAASKNADIVYCDEDYVDETGAFASPHFKPEFSPELLLSTDYFGGAWLVRRSLLSEIQTTTTYARSWLWEIALSVSHRTSKIYRIPKILVHRHKHQLSNDIHHIQQQMNTVIADNFRHHGVPCQSVVTPSWAASMGKLVCSPRFNDNGPQVAIIIPTKNQHTVVKRCIDSLRNTTYENYHIYLIDNESDDPTSIQYFESLNNHRTTVLKIDNLQNRFSYSYVNNRAVEKTAGERYLLFLNNDTEVIDPRWLSQMVGWQQLPGVGSVGALLYFPREEVQHAGITHKLLCNVLPAPSFKIVPRGDLGYQDYIGMARDSAAQTAACLLTPRNVFIENGMFDEVDFNVAYNDCDYGFKLAQKGLRNVYCPDAVLYHHEGYSRGVGKGNDKPSEEAAFVRKFSEWDDPYYNPNLAVGRTDFAIQPTSPITGQIPDLKVAIVTHNLNFEGAPLVLLEIARGLTKSGNVHPVIFSMQDGQLKYLYEELGCEVMILKDCHLFFNDEQHDQPLRTMMSLLETHRIDVVFANTVLCWWAIESAKLCSIPSIWLIHESEPPFTHLAEHSQYCAERGRKALAYPYRTVFVSWATRTVFEHLETTYNYHTIYNGFDIAEYENKIIGKSRQEIRQQIGISEDTIVVLLIGTVCERKSQLDAVDAIKLMDRSVVSKMCMLIVGDRPSAYSTLLHSKVKTLSVEKQSAIRILPHCSNAEDYFLASDIMISTAKIEAFPKVIQEAMFFGLPMVVAPVFGVQEQVTDEVSALYFPAGDSNKLAEQLTRLIRSSELRQHLSFNAKQSLGRFPSASDMTKEYYKIICEAWLTKGNDVFTAEAPSENDVVSSFWGDEFDKMRSSSAYWQNNHIIRNYTYNLISDSPSHWLPWLFHNYFSHIPAFNNVLSICCGDGAHEIEMFNTGKINFLHAIDISEKALTDTRNRFVEAQIPESSYRLELQDVNMLNVTGSYDLVISAGASHHIENLEYVFEKIEGLIRGGGYFVLLEYIGPNRFQWTGKQIDLINGILSQLTSEYLRDQKLVTFGRPDVEDLIKYDPSEAIRSADICRLVHQYFSIEYSRNFNGTILHQLYPLLNNELCNEKRNDFDSILRLITYFEDVLVKNSVIDPDFTFMICKSKMI